MFREHIGSMDKYYRQTKTQTEIYTDEGIFVIENNKIYKLGIDDIRITKNLDSNMFHLILDESVVTREETTQLPKHNIVIPTTNFYYSLDPKSKIKFVIEGGYNKVSNNKYDGFIPTDCYFELPNYISINSYIVNEELNVFFSNPLFRPLKI